MIPSFLTTLLFSISAVSGQRSARLLGGTEANFLRLLIGTMLLGLLAHSFGGGLSGAALPVFLISGLIGFGVGDVALFQALPRIGSRLAMVLVLCLSSPVGALIEWWWLGTALSTAQIRWALVTLAGIGLALSPGRHLEIHARGFTTGVLYGLVASVCQALGAVTSRKAFAIAAASSQSIDGMTAAYQRILGGLVIAFIVYLTVKKRRQHQAAGPGDGQVSSLDWRTRWKKSRNWILLNAISGSVLGVSCFQWALKTAPSGVVLPIVALTPVVIIPFSRYVEGERPTKRSLVGGVIAVIGAVNLALNSTR